MNDDRSTLNSRARRRQWRRRITVVGILLIAAMAAKPAWHLWRTMWSDRVETRTLPPGSVDDASRLNATKMAEVWAIETDRDGGSKWVGQLAKLLRRAKTDGTKVSIAGSRHSMGGHVISPDGVMIDTSKWNAMTLDEDRDVLRVQAGATWAQILPYLDARQRSVAIMQSNNSFSVGGSISVNCHGWQLNKAPIASTVKSFRIMTADGQIHRCSRSENSELFSLALGGYGLFGVILDVELQVVPNCAYRLEQAIVPVNESLLAYQNLLRKGDVQLAYARMNIVPQQLFDEVIVNVFHPSADPIPELAAPGLASLRRTIFRGSAESDYGKQLRWAAEAKLQPWIQNRIVSRNQLFNEGVEVFENRRDDTTDILHEYFVPQHQVVGFVESMRRIVRRRRPNLLNVTVRSVQTDRDTFLRYADAPMYCFVMLFVQKRNATGEKEMLATTRELIDAALAHQGRHYLPYRLHATPAQFNAAYPQAAQFFEKKRQYDPDERFDNQFYRKYGTLPPISSE